MLLQADQEQGAWRPAQEKPDGVLRGRIAHRIGMAQSACSVADELLSHWL